jgi:hypothetical protein
MAYNMLLIVIKIFLMTCFIFGCCWTKSGFLKCIYVNVNVNVAATPAADDFRCCQCTRKEWYTVGFCAVIFTMQNCVSVHTEKIPNCVDIEFGISKSHL